MVFTSSLRAQNDIGATKELTHFLHHFDYEQLPEQVVERVKYLLLDYMGVALGGSRSESSQPVYQMIDRMGSTGPCTLIGQSICAPPGLAALANGTAAHSLELDDTHQAGSIHLGVVMFSTAIAASEARREVGGKLFIASAVAGYEAAARLAMALQPKQHYLRGFHPTATCGVFGAAVTSSKLFGLDVEQMLSALGIAGSMASGSMEFLAEGSWTKRLHAGLAAQNGLQAAMLAAEGFQGPGTIIEGRDGFLWSYSDSPSPDFVTRGLGCSFEVSRTSVKPHACCRYMQAPIDGIIELATEHRIRPDQVRRIEVAVLEAGFPLVCEPEERKYHPQSVVDAQFSMPFGAAVALIQRRASLSEFTEENLKCAHVRDLMKRVSMVKDVAIEKNYPVEWPSRVVIELQGGERLEKFIRHPKGDPENPFSWDELSDKFRELAKPVLPPERCEEIERKVRMLEGSKNLSDIWGLLWGQAR